MSFTLAHVSDTHLGAGTPLFHANFARVAAERFVSMRVA